MPRQHTLFGRPISPRQMSQLFAGVVIFAIVTVVYSIPSSIPGPSLQSYTAVPRQSIAKISKTLKSSGTLFRPPAHKPPVQDNSTSGDISWHTEWNWLNPFSSSVTMDEERTLLPPLPPRPRVYTYYDHTVKKDVDVKTAESNILLTWRKAWWAQGFRPIILGPADMMANPSYEMIHSKKYEDGVMEELSQWLAWEGMGDGIFCHYTVLPMGKHEDPLLSQLRRGEFDKLTRYEGLGNRLFSGSKPAITTAVKAFLAAKDPKEVVSTIGDSFKVEGTPKAIASYDPATIKAKYEAVHKALASSEPKGLTQLRALINAHLHNTWQNSFSRGILVLKPMPEHTTALISPAHELAKYLSQCPDSPIPSSCPPNIRDCKPCHATQPMKITTPEQYQNETDLYVLGTVPHPYTRVSLTSLREKIDVPYIRRSSARDEWLFVITKSLLGTGVSSAPRILKFKNAVAGSAAEGRSLWVSAERRLPSDLDWHFGFAVPKTVADMGKSETPVPGPERRPKPQDSRDPNDGPVASEQDLAVEKQLLAQAKRIVVKGEGRGSKELRRAVEAWNLADSEAWRFVRAYGARKRMERRRWEEEEKAYAGGAGGEDAARKQGWGRWFDRRREGEA
jgi:hypothetical protein